MKNWNFLHLQQTLDLAVIICVEGGIIQDEQANKLAIINRTIFENGILMQNNTGIYCKIFWSTTYWSIKYTVKYRYHSFMQDFPA